MSRGIDLARRSVVLITLDSCRYDVAAAARVPNLSSLSPLCRAESPATYTLPAHTALFNGFLPQPGTGTFTIDGHAFRAVWRSAAARPTRDAVAIPFAGRTIMDDYGARGWRVIGAGGVTFFDAGNADNLLPTFFPEFHYYGGAARAGGRSPAGPRDRKDDLALSHVDDLATHCLDAEDFFLFVNCASTHIPYTTPDRTLTTADAALLERLYARHDAGPRPLDEPPLRSDETAALLRMQRSALEWADGRLGLLFDRLRRRQPLVVVCADHGESFGEGGRFGHAYPHETVTTVPLWCGILR